MTTISQLTRPIRDTLTRSHQAIKKLTKSQQGLRGSAQGWKPTVESLEGREVPSAALPDVNLSTRGATGEINGAIFTQYSPQPTGTGYINSFLRVQAQGTAPIEQGYNTDARPLQFNELKTANFTRSIRLSDVPQVSVGGVPHYAFMLDINQSSKAPFLSLDQLRLFAAPAGNMTGYNTATGKLAGLSPVYDMDKDADHWVKLNAQLNPGSGRGDMMVYVPASAFSGAGADPYVYLFGRFGDHFASNGGFEEWSVGCAAPGPITPPTFSAPASLSGYVYEDSNFNSLYNTGESRLTGVMVTLTGLDAQGNAVNLTTTTDAYGAYRFTGLAAGTYSLNATLPLYYTGSAGNVGSAGGSALSDGSIGSITLKGGDLGADYNFGLTAFVGV